MEDISSSITIMSIDNMIRNNQIEVALKHLAAFTSDCAEAQFLKALCKMKLPKPDFQGALNDLLEIEKEKCTEIIEYMICYCKYMLQDYEEVILFYISSKDRFLKLNQNLQVIIASSFEKSGMKDKSRKLYLDILSAHPENLSALNNLFVQEMKNENKDYVISPNFLNSIEQSLEASNNYALFLIQNDQFEEGLSVFEKVLAYYKRQDLSLSFDIYQKVLHSFVHNLIMYGDLSKAEIFITNEIMNKSTVTTLDVKLFFQFIQKVIYAKRYQDAFALITKYSSKGHFREAEAAKQATDYIEELQLQLGDAKSAHQITPVETFNNSQHEHIMEHSKNPNEDNPQYVSMNHQEIALNSDSDEDSAIQKSIIKMGSKDLFNEFSTSIMKELERGTSIVSDSHKKNEMVQANSIVQNNGDEQPINEQNQEKNEVSNDNSIRIFKRKSTDNIEENKAIIIQHEKEIEEKHEENTGESCELPITNNENVEERKPIPIEINDDHNVEEVNENNHHKGKGPEERIEKVMENIKNIENSTHPVKIESFTPLSIDNMFSKMTDAFHESNFDECLRLIQIIRNANPNYHHREICEISAQIYFVKKEYQKVIEEISQFYKDLDDDLMSQLISSFKKSEMNEEYKNIMIHYYDNRNDDESVCIDAIEACSAVNDIEKTEKYVNNLIEKSDPILRFKKYSTIVEALLKRSTILDYVLPILEKMKTLAKGPEEVTIHQFLMGRYFLKKNQINSAFEYFARLEEEPSLKQNSSFHKLYGKAYMRLKNFKKAIKHFKTSLRIDPSDWISSLHTGDCYLKLGRADRASKYLEYCIKIDPNHLTNIKLNFSLGNLYLNLRKFNEAIAMFNKCLDAQGNKAYKVYFNLAKTNLEMKEYEEAERLFNTCLSCNPNFFPASFEIFKMKVKNGGIYDLNKETENIETNIHNFPFIYVDYAILLIENFKDTTNSLRYFNFALSKDGKNINIAKAVEYGCMLFFTDRKALSKAIECFRNLLRLNNRQYQIYKGLNRIFLNLRNYEDAIKTTSAYLRICPDSLEGNYDLGEYTYCNQEYAKCLSSLVKVAEIQASSIKGTSSNDPAFPMLNKRIGLCELQLKAYERASHYLRQFDEVSSEQNICLIIAYINYIHLSQEDVAKEYLNKEISQYSTRIAVEVAEKVKEYQDIDIQALINESYFKD